MKHVKDGDVIRLTVDFDERALHFALNGDLQASCEFAADVSALYLVTELDAAGDCVELRRVMTRSEAVAENSTTIEQVEKLSQSCKFARKLKAAAQWVEGLSASQSLTEGVRSLDVQSAVQSIELNQNPRIGGGGGAAMTLLVQMAHLAAGQHLLRLHLANCQIEDEGTRVLTQAFAKGFAPRLQILWLSENCIADAGAAMLSDALLSSLECLAELSLSRCCLCFCVCSAYARRVC